VFLVKKNNNFRLRAGETALNLSFVINKRFELGRWLLEREAAGEPIRIALAKKFWNLSFLRPTIKTIFGKYVWAKC